MATYEEILSRKYRGSRWTMAGPYDTLDWDETNEIPKPTQAELDALQVEVQHEIQWESIRRQRNNLLRMSDWTQLNDVPKKTRDAWKKYRQELRDITEFFDDPDFIIWPEKPE